MTETIPATPTPATTPAAPRTIPYNYRMPVFAVPASILNNGLLRKLSGDGLALFLLLASKLYRRKSKEIPISDFELSIALSIPIECVTIPRAELHQRNLIEFKRTSQGALYRFTDEGLAPRPFNTNTN